MNDLANLFPMFFSLSESQAPVSIAVAAIVFFYFVYLLRKEENMAQAETEKPATDARTEKRQQA